MQVEISPAAHERLERLVRKGIYDSVDEAMEAAIFSLDIDEIDWDRLAAAHRDGVADIEAGRYRVIDETFLAEFRSRMTHNRE